MWLFKVNFHPCAIFEKVVNKGLSECQHRCLLTLLKNPKSVLLTSGKCRFLAKENTKRKRDFYWGVSSSSEEALSRPQLSFEAVKAKRKAAFRPFFSILVCAVIMADEDYNTEVNTTAITGYVFAQENTTLASSDDNGGKSQFINSFQVSFYHDIVLKKVLD